jgi:hypothetical protein
MNCNFTSPRYQLLDQFTPGEGLYSLPVVPLNPVMFHFLHSFKKKSEMGRVIHYPYESEESINIGK